MNVWENLKICKHKTQEILILEQIRINTKHDTISKHLTLETIKKQNIPHSHTVTTM